MEFIKREFINKKRELNQLVAKRGSVIVSFINNFKIEGDFMVLVDPPERKIEFSIFHSDGKCEFERRENNYLQLRIEIEENIKSPLPNDLKISYLDEILTFYISKESMFTEDENGRLSCSFVIIPEDELPLDRNKDARLQDGLIEIRKYLRNEIVYLYELKKGFGEISSGSSNLMWKGTDTELLELIQALLETKKISLPHKEISRKDAIRIFEQIFSFEIKDAESKLSRATERKMDNSPFLTSLKEAFNRYCELKEEKKNQRS